MSCIEDPFRHVKGIDLNHYYSKKHSKTLSQVLNQVGLPNKLQIIQEGDVSLDTCTSQLIFMGRLLYKGGLSLT